MKDESPQANPSEAVLSQPDAVPAGSAGTGDAEPQIRPEGDGAAPPGGAPAAVLQPRPARSAPFALMLAVAALAGMIFVGWQARGLSAGIADLERQLAARSSNLDTDIAAVDAAQQQLQAALSTLETSLGELPAALAQLERRVSDLEGGGDAMRRLWLRTQAEYFLTMANARLAIAGDIEGAMAAIRLADDTLRVLADPRLAAIRAQLADDLLGLAAVRMIDTEGVAFSLARLTARVPSLPLRAGSPDRVSAADVPAPGSGLGRLWQQLRGALGSLVRIERLDDGVPATLGRDEQRLVRQQLAVELQIARLALLRSERVAFRSAVTSARQLLSDAFDSNAAETVAALALIDSLLELEIAPALPDISAALAALRLQVGN